MEMVTVKGEEFDTTDLSLSSSETSIRISECLTVVTGVASLFCHDL